MHWNTPLTHGRRLLVGTIAVLLASCGGKEPPATAAAPEAAAPPSSAEATPAAAPAAPAPDLAVTLAPEALEDLLAPIALYPDVVLGHVLAASTNPQEVLDAGNWLIQNASLSGKELDQAAGPLGLSTSMRALLQFPEVVDMMCMKLDWTTELGQAFTADQGAVLDAVQRLRTQAQDVGNLASSPQLKVETVTQEEKQVITVSPPSPEVVYVPTYDPAAVYAPPPATIPPPTNYATTGVAPTTAAPVTTTTESDKKYSTGSLVTTGLLAFGAGILVNEIFDDDDDDWNKYYPNYGYGGMYYGGRPYYPPPPYMYRPPYGGGYYPAHNYNRPPNYQHGFNNNTIIVNNGGNDYWNRYDGKPGRSDYKASSPISKAKPNRPELTSLNQQGRERADNAKQRTAARPATADQQRPASLKDAKQGQVQGGYAGARPENQAARDQMVGSRPASAKDAKAGGKVQGSYAGARPGNAQARDKAAANAQAAANRAGGSRPQGKDMPQRPDTRDVKRPSSPAEAKGKLPTSRPAAKPAVQPTARPAQNIDRGKPAAKPQARPASKPSSRPAPAPSKGGGGFSAGGGQTDRAAAQRGKASMPKGAKSYGGGGGGQGKKAKGR